MRKVALFAVLLLIAAATCGSAQTWFWATGGGADPTTVLTSEGKVAWNYTYHDTDCYFEPVWVSPTDTALRVIDGMTTKKIRWDATANALKDNVSDGFTIAFRIKGESIAAGGAYKLTQFANKLKAPDGTTGIQTKLALNVFDNGGRIAVSNADKSNFIIGNIDDGFHEIWTRHYLTASKQSRIAIYFDGVQVQDYAASTTSYTTTAVFGVDSLPGMATYQLDYFGYSLDGGWTPGQLPAIAPWVPEPGSLLILASGIGALGMLRRRKAR